MRGQRASCLASLALTATLLLVPAARLDQVSGASPDSPDDSPAVLAPKTALERPDDGQNPDRLDAYYWSRLAGGDQPMSLEQVAAARQRAGRDATAMDEADTPGAARGGTWTSAGPDPDVQIGFSSGALEAMSGRVGALAIRRDGTLLLGAAQGGVWTYDESSRTWTSRSGPGDSEAVGALAVAPSNDLVVYMGSGEAVLSHDGYYGDGIYRSSDGGLSWQRVSGDVFLGAAVSAIAVDPMNADHLFIATARGRGGERGSTHPINVAYGVWESSDGGATWALRKGTAATRHGATALVMDPLNPRVLWASFWADGIYRSADGGQTWTAETAGLPSGQFNAYLTRFSLGLSHPAGRPATVYTGFDYVDASGAYHPARVYRTRDDGATWTALPTGSGDDSVLGYCGTQCWYDNEVIPDPTDPDVLYVLGQYDYTASTPSGGIYRSTDGGSTWVNLGWDLHPDFHALAFAPGNTSRIVVGSDGGAWESTHRGGRLNAGDPLNAVDWTDLNGTVDPLTGRLVHATGLRITQFESIAAVPTVSGQFWGGTQDNGTMRKSLLNDRWFTQAGGDGGKVVVDGTTTNSANPFAAAYVFGTKMDLTPFRFDPSEVGSFFSDENIGAGIDPLDRADFYPPLVENGGNPAQLFLGSYRLYRSDNAETARAADVRWSPISPDLTSGCEGPTPGGAFGCVISAIGLADGGTGVYTGAEDGYVYVSPDAVTATAPAWTRVGAGVFPARPVTQIAVDRSNWRTAYVAFAGYGAATPGNRSHVYATSDGGEHWSDISANLPDCPVNSIVIDPHVAHVLYVATDVGDFVTVDGGVTWKRLGAGMPRVATFQLDDDPADGVLVAGTHGRGAYTLSDDGARPALVLSSADDGVPVGPGSRLAYTFTVRNIGGADAHSVRLDDPIPANTAFVSADAGGSLHGSRVEWDGLSVPARASVTVHLDVAISPNLPSSVTSIIDDGLSARTTDAMIISGSPHTTTIAPAHAVTVTPQAQEAAARDGNAATFRVHVSNVGYSPDSYRLAATGLWQAQVRDAACANGIAMTATLAPGSGTDVCVEVTVPTGTADAATTSTQLGVTSMATPAAYATANLTAIAVTTDVLLVDGDGSAPDVEGFYENALAANGVSYSYRDLTSQPGLPVSLLTTHEVVVWFTGNSYPSPVAPFESQLTTFLDGGGRLLLSGQDILDQTGGTTAFMHDYVHIAWDGSEAQNDHPTAAVHGVAGSPLTDGIGAVTLDHSILGSAFEDQVTPIAPAAAAFTDDNGAADALTVSTSGYKVIFLAFPFEAYGSDADKATLMQRALAFLR